MLDLVLALSKRLDGSFFGGSFPLDDFQILAWRDARMWGKKRRESPEVKTKVSQTDSSNNTSDVTSKSFIY